MARHTARPDPARVVNDLVGGKLIRIPDGFVSGPDGRERAAAMVRHFLLDECAIPEDQIPKLVSGRTFSSKRLGSLIGEVFGGSVVGAVEAAFPGRFKPWHFKNAPKGFWRRDDAAQIFAQAAREYIRDRMKWSDDDILERGCKETFREAGLGTPLKDLFNNSPLLALRHVFPELADRKDWEFNALPKGYWAGVDGKQHARLATRWLFVEVLRAPAAALAETCTKEVFIRAGLGAMLQVVYGNCPSDAVIDAFPEATFSPNDFGRVGNRFWQSDEGREEARRMTREIFSRLPVGPNGRRTKLTRKSFKDADALGMLQIVYNGSPAAAVADAFPEQSFSPKEVSTPRGGWTGPDGLENATRATRQMVKNAGLAEDATLPTTIREQHFRDAGLEGMLDQRFGSVVAAAIMEAYPGKYRKAEFPRTRNKWSQKTATGRVPTKDAIEEVRRLIEKLFPGHSGREVAAVVRRAHFEENALAGLIQHTFKGDPASAVMTAFPEWNLMRGDFRVYQQSKAENSLAEILRSLFGPDERILRQHLLDRSLKSVGGRRLDFDIYLPDRNLAVMYHGEQHYLPGFWGETTEDVDRRRANDGLRREWCSANGIHLIEWSYEWTLTETEVRKQLRAVGLAV